MNVMQALRAFRSDACAPRCANICADKGPRKVDSNQMDHRFTRRKLHMVSEERKITCSSALKSGNRTCTDADLRTTAVMDLTHRFLVNTDSFTSIDRWGIIAMLAATVFLASPEIASAAQERPIADIAENTDFWANVLRYVSYFFSVLLGTVYVALKPLAELLKRPTTAVLVIAGTALLYFFVSTTVGAMLGLNDIIDYEPKSIVTP